MSERLYLLLNRFTCFHNHSTSLHCQQLRQTAANLHNSFMWLKPCTFWHSLHQPANELDKTQFMKTSIKLLYVSVPSATLRKSSATQDHKSNTLIHGLNAASLRYYNSRLHKVDKEGTALTKRDTVWYMSSWVVLYWVHSLVDTVKQNATHTQCGTVRLSAHREG